MSPIRSKVSHKLTTASPTSMWHSYMRLILLNCGSQFMFVNFMFVNWQNFKFISTFYYAIDSNKWSEIRIEQLSRIVYLVLFKCSITTLTFILKIQRWVIISTLELNYYSSKAQLGSWYCMVYRHSSYCSTKCDFDCYIYRNRAKKTGNPVENHLI